MAKAQATQQEKTLRKIRADKSVEAWLIASDLLDDMGRDAEAAALREFATFALRLQETITQHPPKIGDRNYAFAVNGVQYLATVWGGQKVTSASLERDGKRVLAQSNFQRKHFGRPDYLFRKACEIAGIAGLVAPK